MKFTTQPGYRDAVPKPILNHRRWLLALFLLLLGTLPGLLQAANRSTINAGITTSNISNGSFEQPVLPANTFRTRPTGAGWNFYLHSGIARNNSPFTGNQAAPNGQQVLYLQIRGRVTRAIGLAPGTYRLQMRAAQRRNHLTSNQTFAVRVNGETVATIRPTSTNYGVYYTAAFKVTSSSNILELEGLNPIGGDHTAFVDYIRAEKMLPWSANSSWVGGIRPGINDNVTITPNANMVLDQSVNVNTLTIKGKLRASSTQHLNLTAKRILVEGSGSLLEWGKEDCPYLKRGIITLKGSNPNDSLVNVGAKFLAARMGGRVEIHGAPRKSWTQLALTANKNATSIRLKEPVDWQPKDKIVIASTDFEARQAETFNINAISSDKKTVYLDGSLQYMHYGALQNYSNGQRNFSLDERAEVGLLSHNIVIQGDASSVYNGFGGHTMFMPGSVVHISGTEFYRMGQRKKLARYPFHWHIAGNVPGQYLKNSSIHVSYNRVAVIHRTNDALIEGVVGYDHVGHGFFLESGNEIRNTFRNNLGILTKKPTSAEQMTPHDFVLSDQRGLILLPATFWITNPDNNFIGNAAAGSDGSGFWMTSQSAPILPAPPQNPPPYRRPLRQFEDNRAHSNSFSNFSIDGQVQPTTQEFVFGHYRPQISNNVQSVPIVRRYTGFKARERNVWVRGNTMRFIDCSLADTPRNTFFAYNQVLENSLIVGKSNNVGNPSTAQENLAGRSLGQPNMSYLDQWNIFSGHTIYDGPCVIDGVHFAGFTGNNAHALRINAAAVKSPVHRARNTTWQAGTPAANRVEFGTSSYAETMYSSGLIDEDGSITGYVNGRITPQIKPHPSNGKISEEGFNIEPGAILRQDWNAYITRFKRYGLVELRNGWGFGGNGTPTYNIRQQGSNSFAAYGAPIFQWYNQNPVILSDLSYEYHWQYHKIPNEVKAFLEFSNVNDYMISAFTNMPSTTRVYTNSGSAMPQATSLSNLKNSNSQRYWFRNNTLYVKHIASQSAPSYLWQHGYQQTAQGAPVKICQNSNCGSPAGRTDGVTLADFEMGPDSRVVRGRSGNLPQPNLVWSTNSPSSGPFNGFDDYVRWTMQGDGDGQNEYTQIRIDFPRQVWNEFKYMAIDYSGPRFQVYVLDKTDGFKNYGYFTPPASGKTIVNLNPAAFGSKLDETVRVIIRVREAQLGSLNSTPTRTITVRGIKLYIDTPPGGFKTAPLAEAGAAPEAAGLSLYPNPATDHFTLEMPFAQVDVLSLEVYNLQGQAVLRKRMDVAAGAWSEKFDLADLPRGMYKVVLKTALHGIHSRSLVLQ